MRFTIAGSDEVYYQRPALTIRRNIITACKILRFAHFGTSEHPPWVIRMWREWLRIWPRCPERNGDACRFHDRMGGKYGSDTCGPGTCVQIYPELRYYRSSYAKSCGWKPGKFDEVVDKESDYYRALHAYVEEDRARDRIPRVFRWMVKRPVPPKEIER